MSFLGGAECSTAGNPLSQFTKHVQDDKSLQRDRLVGTGPNGVQEGFRSQMGGQVQDEVDLPNADSVVASFFAILANMIHRRSRIFYNKMGSYHKTFSSLSPWSKCDMTLRDIGQSRRRPAHLCGLQNLIRMSRHD